MSELKRMHELTREMDKNYWEIKLAYRPWWRWRLDSRERELVRTIKQVANEMYQHLLAVPTPDLVDTMHKRLTMVILKSIIEDG